MKASRKQVAIGATLVLTLIALWQAPEESNAGVALSSHAQTALARPTEVKTPAMSNALAAAPTEVLDIQPRTDGDDAADATGRLFVAAAPAVTPVAQAEANQPMQEPPAPPPQAPALPFRFVGRYDEAGETTVFLQYMDQNLAVRRGDTVADVYKVEELQGASMSIRYLPLDQVQTLEIGRGQ